MTMKNTTDRLRAVACIRFVRQRPLAGWRHWKGPVWEHPAIGRVHCAGLWRRLDGTIVNINMDDREWKRVNAQQPRRIRALMVRAQSLANDLALAQIGGEQGAQYTAYRHPPRAPNGRPRFT